MKILNWYYKRPILIDYILSAFILGFMFLLNDLLDLNIINANTANDISLDIGAIGLTVSGFILTLVTILITFKSGEILSDNRLDNDSNPFKIFLSSPLYKKSINILKYGVLSLVIISISIFIIKLFSGNIYFKYTLSANIIGIVIISSTFIRCFYVLNIILKMQEFNPENE
ncbi:hypothetical protein LCGC14_0265980 [marine sediment metagenome]|uniref:Uncharacterized protein n=1 Tax=marine sediment metagenome TaxID=412755 RepID=A0A0F9U074_9ZZZZ|nr:hypothetical protein [Maribacter sp.]HDZ03512.1 hypothetical protein [Maribacter sp.]HEA79453.1 hypothetical protein [Maribacter sp.]